jgi:hypothetical protein
MKDSDLFRTKHFFVYFVKITCSSYCTLHTIFASFFILIGCRHYFGTLPIAELEFLKRLWGLGTEEEEGYRTGPSGYIGWRNSFLGINSGAPYTFKNTSSVLGLEDSCTVDCDERIEAKILVPDWGISRVWDRVVVPARLAT